MSAIDEIPWAWIEEEDDAHADEGVVFAADMFGPRPFAADPNRLMGVMNGARFVGGGDGPHAGWKVPRGGFKCEACGRSLKVDPNGSSDQIVNRCRPCILATAAVTRVTASAAVEQVSDLCRVGKPRRSKRARSLWSPSQVDRCATESRAMRESRDWSGAEPKHLVALYVWCHDKTYGVSSELAGGGAPYAGATSMAKRQLDKDFGGDVEAMLTYMRWAWAREMRREKWRRENDVGERPRLGWRAMFGVGGSVVTDWRVDVARRGEKVNG